MKITKKKVVLCSIISIILIGGIILAYNLGKSDSPTLAESKPEKLINNSFLTLMLEQSDGTYQESTSNTWPSGNYAFNSELSRCENGGELRWDREQGIVELLSNKSDACYVYFDLYNVVQISNVEATKTYNSITVTVTTSGGDDPLEEIVYVVKRGDTLSRIALNYGTTVSQIVRENNISNPNLIYPGQRLVVKTQGMETELGHSCYKVVRGDTLYSIARRYNTTIANIVMLNRIQNPNLIYPGECLRLRR